ncbi:MAG TPA: hypothetical protein PKK10_11640 [Woeseiaceae bacterium]|nr:hypothetical protein [Woeseiaceae bacterium]
MFQDNTNAVAAMKRRSAERAESYRWFVERISHLTIAQITDSLNSYRLNTPSGRGQWSTAMTSRLLKQLGVYGERPSKRWAA